MMVKPVCLFALCEAKAFYNTKVLQGQWLSIEFYCNFFTYTGRIFSGQSFFRTGE